MRCCNVTDFPHQKMTRCFIINLACFTRLITFYVFYLLFFFFTLRIVLIYTAKTKGERINNIEDMQHPESSIIAVLSLYDSQSRTVVVGVSEANKFRTKSCLISKETLFLLEAPIHCLLPTNRHKFIQLLVLVETKMQQI